MKTNNKDMGNKPNLHIPLCRFIPLAHRCVLRAEWRTVGNLVWGGGGGSSGWNVGAHTHALWWFFYASASAWIWAQKQQHPARQWCGGPWLKSTQGTRRPPRARQLAVWSRGQLKFSPLKSAGRLRAEDWTSSCHIAMNEFSSSLSPQPVLLSEAELRRGQKRKLHALHLASVYVWPNSDQSQWEFSGQGDRDNTPQCM